ncbi:MAG: sugar-binding protein [Candidatus Zipacnadales bacterium]
MKGLGFLMIALITTPGPAERLLLHPAQSLSSWSADNGGEFPGAKASLQVVEDDERGPCLEGHFSFGGESRYSGARWQGEIPRAQAIGFWVKLPDHSGGLIRLRDATEQEHLSGFTVEQGRWVKVEIPVKPEAFPNYWGGTNDGQFHFPLTRVLIGVSRGPDETTLRVSDLYVVTENLRPEERWQLDIRPEVPCGVAFRGERAEFSAHLTNRLQRDARCELIICAEGLASRRRQMGRWKVELSAWTQRVITFSMPTKEIGYWKLTGWLTDAEVGELSPTTSGLVVVPQARHYGEWAHDCYFGLQWIPDLEAAEKLGCKAVRILPGWRWGEHSPGDPYLREYLESTIAGAYDHQMDVLVTLQYYAPNWVRWHVEGRPRLADLPDPNRFEEVTRFAQVAAEVFAGRATAIEIQNEPDLTCWMHPGLSFEEGVEYYVKLLRASRAGIHAVDPDVPIAGLDVSGGDFDTGLRFTRAVLERGADLLDLYTGHPYASPRYFGPAQNPVWPMQNQMADKCRQALDLVASFGRPRRMWIGELGWGLQNIADPLSEHSLNFAACIAQSLIVGKTVPGVEKHLYFTMQGCNEHGNEYGLVRGSPSYPLPAALAYASTAYLLDATQPLKLEQVAGQLWRATFTCPSRNELIAVYWSEGAPVSVRPPSDAPKGRWVDGFLHPLRAIHSVPVGRLPVYWILPLAKVGTEPTFLQRAQVTAPSAVTVQQIYVAGRDRIAVVLTNETNASQRAEVEIAGQRARVDLPPGAVGKRGELRLPEPLPLGEERELTVRIVVGAQQAEQTLIIDLWPLSKPPAGVKIDGDLGEWIGLPSLKVRDRQAVLPPDPSVGWDGPEDLSVQAQLAADKTNLYVAFTVTDDIHSAPLVEGGTFWNSDSLQLALDPGNNSRNGFDEDDREIGFVLAADGPRAYLTYPEPGKRLTIPLAIIRQGTTTTYEASVPWEVIEVPAPAAGDVRAINFIANENDGPGRAYWMGLTPGIGEGKAPQSYRKFVLVE